MRDIVKLCMALNIMPKSNKDSEDEIVTAQMETHIKNTVWEYQFLQEKVKKRSFKCKEILHPILERKKVLTEVLQQVWDT